MNVSRPSNVSSESSVLSSFLLDKPLDSCYGREIMCGGLYEVDMQQEHVLKGRSTIFPFPQNRKRESPMDINDLMPQGFDAVNQPEPEKQPPMPPGCPGNCMVTPEPKFVQTKAATGYYLQVEMIVLSGPFAGRKLWDRLNVSNPNPLAEQIAKSQLKKLCLACGIQNLQSKAELMGKIVRPKIKVDGIYNVVTGYDVADMAELAAAQQAAVDAANAPAAPVAASDRTVLVVNPAPVPFEGAADPVPTAANPFPQQQQ